MAKKIKLELEEEYPGDEIECIVRKSVSGFAGKKAKRDHVILQNDFQVNIKKGDFLDEIPERFYETLKTEKVI